MRATIRRPGADRRREIAEAVLRIIGRDGARALSTTSLAAEIGVTAGALFRHFRSSEEMLQAAAENAVTRIETTLPGPAGRPLERLMALVTARVNLLRSDPGIAWLLRSEEAYLILPQAAVEQLRGLIRRSERTLLDAIKDGMAEGTIRHDIEPESLLVLVLGTIHALTGMSGVHRFPRAARGRDPARVLGALEHVLKPPDSGTGANS